jgi:hypothetical protein
MRSATEIIGELRQHSSASGNAVQRMAYYYMEALVSGATGSLETLSRQMEQLK